MNFRPFLHIQFLLFACMLSLSACQAQPQNESSGNSLYTHTAPSRDGTGKWYLGREIAQVMGHQGAGWLERPEREAEERTDLLIEALGLSPAQVVADIGAGTGYFSFRMAPLLPQGKVIAVDIQQEMLDMIVARQQESGISNIETRLGSISNPGLDNESVDVVLIVDVYHEFSHPYEMMQAIVRAMKPGGRLFLVEYRLEDPAVPIKRLHKMSLEQAKKEMAVVGLQLVENKSMLPWQHLMVFEKMK
ncbi:MAG: class I SAM-dependent methyltransferase [Bacteroidetes bacterium]|nr:MAG: class I SAM-dependent methyltransferase [Bacteroidota bacterium]